MTEFLILWLGQLVSSFGSMVCAFALAASVFQRTGSATAFAFTLVASAVPAVLAAPIAGSFVDRDGRKALILSDAVAIGMTLLTLNAAQRGELALPWIYAQVFVGSLCNSVRAPAFAAVSARLTRREDLGRVSGFIELLGGIAAVATPLCAGVALNAVGVRGLLCFDAATFVLAVATAALVRPRRAQEPAPEHDEPRSLWQDARLGWEFLRTQSTLLRLLLLVSATALAMAAMEGVFMPLLLSITTLRRASEVMTLGGVGALVGALASTRRISDGGRAWRILASIFLTGAMLVIGGLGASVATIACAAFFVLLLSSFVNSDLRALCLGTTPEHVHGRVLTAAQLPSTIAHPLGLLVSGPLVERVFAPTSTRLSAVWPSAAVGGPASFCVALGAGLSAMALVALLHHRVVARA